MVDFAELIENIKQLDYEQLIEINSITENYLIEKERERIYSDHLESQKEFNSKTLKFSSDVKLIMSQLDEL